MRILTLLLISFMFTNLWAVEATPAIKRITLINNYDNPLSLGLRLSELQGKLTVGIPRTLGKGEKASFGIRIVPKPDKSGYKEAFIRVEDPRTNGNAFFGVSFDGSSTRIRGYVAKGIAFSWTDDRVTFCTPQEYARRNRC